MKLKFDLVEFKGLNTWFHSALQVRESTERLNKGDLVVALNGNSFRTLDEAIKAFRQGGQADARLVLHAGLSGKAEFVDVEHRDRYGLEYLEQLRPDSSLITVEIRVRGTKTDAVETRYVDGVCVSMDGLFVAPISGGSIVPNEPIQVVGSTELGHVVGTDEKHRLMLIKIDRPKDPLFWALKSRSGLPNAGQRLSYWQYDARAYKAVRFNAPELSVAEVDAKLPMGREVLDAFSITNFVNHDVVGAVPVAQPGAALISITTGELQGIVVRDLGSSADFPAGRVLAVPAVHVEKMVQDYRSNLARGAE